MVMMRLREEQVWDVLRSNALDWSILRCLIVKYKLAVEQTML